MYTRRFANVTYKPLLKVCRTKAPNFIYSVNALPGISRYLSTSAAERSDFYSNFDVGVDKFQPENVNFDQNGRNLSGVELNQNPNFGVYGQTLNGGIGGERLNFDGRNSGNGVNYDQNSRLYGRNLDRVDENRNTNSLNFDRYNGNYTSGDVGNGNVVQQNANVNGYGNGAGFGMSSQNPNGVAQHSTGARFVGRNYQQSWGASQGHGSIDSQVDPNDIRSDEVAKVGTFRNKLDDLDQFTKEGKLKEAVELLEVIRNEGLEVGLPRYIELMKACGEYEALSEAKIVHGHLLKSIPQLEVRTYNMVLEMYSQCRSMDDAHAVFNQMPQRNMTSWDILISGLAKNDLGEDAIDLFSQFKKCGLKPDGPMFLGVFSACGVLCDMFEGMLHFESMTKDYGIIPTMEHYVSIVEMLGSMGCLEEALEFIGKMPIEPSIAIWETLMKFSRIHGNSELGDRCMELVNLLDPTRLDHQSKAGLIPVNAADEAREKEKRKLSGQHLLGVRSRSHEYTAGDKSHPDNDRIYTLLRGLKQQLKEIGYIPETKFVLHDVDPEVKEEALMAHSERLAAAQAFLTSPARSLVRIIKNLRVCGDCHNTFKLISKIVGREIVARDSKRWHHFRDGSCSCNDYW